MGIAITHDEAYLGESEEHALEAIDLSEHLGTTKMSFYFSRTRRAHWHEAVQVAVEAVRQVYEAEGDVDRTQLEPRPELGERAQH